MVNTCWHLSNDEIIRLMVALLTYKLDQLGITNTIISYYSGGENTNQQWEADLQLHNYT